MHMSKEKKQKQPSEAQKPSNYQQKIPNAPTLFRLKNLDMQTQLLVRKATDKLKPILWIRDGRSVKKIEAAQTPEELIYLIPIASGLAEDAWFDRMRNFGSEEVLPLVSRSLSHTREIEDEDLQDMLLETLILELRWRGEGGGKILLECFDKLSNYGKCLACVVFGLIGVQTSRDKIWRFYRQALKNRQDSNLVGALWGLIDLKDPRAAGALAELLNRQLFINELFGFLSLAGDRDSIIPLLKISTHLPEDDRMDSMMAMISIAHRIGREALAEEIKRAAAGEASIKDYKALADIILSKPSSYAEEYFESFYRGFSPEDVANALSHM
jgi:hypothetical protein